MDNSYCMCLLLHLSGAIALTNQVFSDPQANLVLRDVTCNGSESSLLDCEHNQLGEVFCSALDDAGVVCQGNVLYSVTLIIIFYFITL